MFEFDLAPTGADTIALKIGAQVFSGWKAVRAETGIEQASGAFELSVMDRWTEQMAPWQILPGDACTLLLNDQVVITGYVDMARPRFDARAHGIRITGRDRTMDLIDCSAIYKSGQWKKVKLDRIAGDIAKPFGIKVVAVGDVGDAFDSFSLEMGERAFEAIERAARMRGMLVTTDGTGVLLLTRASKVRSGAALIQGDNIYSGELELSWKERYSEITIKGQGSGSATDFGAKVAHGVARVTDSAITRYRPLIVIAEQQGKSPTFSQRAEWEKNVRLGRGTRANIVVQGWTWGQGALWRPNMLASVQSASMGIGQDLLIAKCSFSHDESGTFTSLQLVHPSALDILVGVRGTGLNKKIRGSDGAESNRKHAKDRAKNGGHQGVDMQTGKGAR